MRKRVRRDLVEQACDVTSDTDLAKTVVEVEHSLEAIKQLESQDLVEEEKWSKMEEIWKVQLTESDMSVQAAVGV